jgi:nucleotide-binding universal stress UspA family protein
MINRILVGTDTSASADMAVTAAAEMARANGAELLVVYVRPETESRHIADPKKAADPQRYLKGIHTRFPGVRTRTREERGDPARSLCAVAQEERTDLIVVGNRGVRDRRAFRRKRVPNAVVRGSPCSVLVVDTRVAQ